MIFLFVAKILLESIIIVDAFDPSKVVFAIDCGSTSYLNSTLGFTYEPDNYYIGGWPWSSGDRSIGLTKNSKVYIKWREIDNNPNSFGYRIPIIKESNYVLILQFAEYYGFENKFTIKIGNYIVKSNWSITSETGLDQAYDIFVQFSLSNGNIYINGNLIPNAYSSGKLVIDFISDCRYALISEIIVVKGDCSTVDNCNMCYGLKCASCNYPSSLTCSTCISNANLNNGICSCNSNYYYDLSVNKCIWYCDKLCSSCYENPFLCTSCASPYYYLVSNVCLKACPYGFSTSCSEIPGAVIDASFESNFNGTYEIFKTGSNESSYYIFNSPEKSDPIPAKNRGLYFSKGAYLETTSNIYFSINFSLGLWVWISPESGHMFTHSDSMITITETGSLNIILENRTESTALITTKNLSPPNSIWVYLSYVVYFSSSSTTIMTYLNNIAKESISQEDYIYRDIPGKTITLGKVHHQISMLWNSAVSNFDTQYLDQLCGAGAIASCLWSCDISSWIYNGKIHSCDQACSTGCVRKNSCSVCYDPLCSVCRGFSDGLCEKCVENASGTPCSCNAGYILSDKEDSCIKSSENNSFCNELNIDEDFLYDGNINFEWKYYKIPLYSRHKNSTIIITTDLYLPQIYISLNSNKKKADFSSKNYSSSIKDGKTLEININSYLAIDSSCISELNGHFDSNKECVYHIGLFSPIRTNYSIIHKSIPIIPHSLQIDSLIASNMTQNEHKYYYGIIDVNSTFFAKINSSIGRTLIYASLFDYKVTGNDPAQWPLPYTSSNIYNTSNFYEGIKLEKGYLISICPSKKCLIEICEICWDGPCQAELSLLNHNYMQSSIYYNETICLECFHYYEIPFYYGLKIITITLSPIDSSDVDLYVSLNANNVKPNISTYDYKVSKSWEASEEIVLNFDSIAQKNCPINLTANHEGDSPCSYHVGIYGFSAAHYKLIYYESDVFNILRTGSVQVKNIGPSKHGVYYSLIDSNFDASIKVDKLISGSMIISIYDYEAVKKDIPIFSKNLDEKTSVVVENDTGILNFNNASLKKWCPSNVCLAQICLHCSKAECYPTLQLLQDNEILIEKGVVQNDFIDEYIIKDYKIPFSYGHKVITVELNIYKGDAEMYISLNGNNWRPSHKIYDYKSNSKLSKKEIILTNDNIALRNCPQFEGISSHEKNDMPCYYHIGIIGKQFSEFSIQIHSSSTLPIELKSNSPISMTNINSTESRFFNLMNSEKYAIISIERIYGETLLYISIFDFDIIGYDSAFWPLPNNATKQYKSKSSISEKLFIRSIELKEACSSGLCIALLCSFCLNEPCEYKIEVSQKVIEDQQGLVFSSSQNLILIGLVLASLAFGMIWLYRRKKKNLMIKDMDKLNELLIDKYPLAEERKASAVNKVSDF